MADTLIFAKVKPDAGALTELFEAASPTVLSSVRACNTGSRTDKVRIARVFGSEPDALEHYLVYDAPVPAGFPYSITEGVTLGSGDSIKVYSRDGSTAFNLSGAQQN